LFLPYLIEIISSFRKAPLEDYVHFLLFHLLDWCLVDTYEHTYFFIMKGLIVFFLLFHDCFFNSRVSQHLGRLFSRGLPPWTMCRCGCGPSPRIERILPWEVRLSFSDSSLPLPRLSLLGRGNLETAPSTNADSVCPDLPVPHNFGPAVPPPVMGVCSTALLLLHFFH